MDRIAYERMAELQATHWWFAARRRILRAELRRIGLPAGARLLDAGCGPGANLSMLAEFGAVTGMEMDAGARAHARGLGHKVVDGRLPGAPFDAGAFDMVGAFDVIEHVEADAAAVADLGRMLKPGGLILATVPANPWMWSAHDLRHHHFRRYEKAGFRALFEQAGLTVERITCFNTLLFPLTAAVRLVKKALNGREGGRPDDQLPPAALNAALREVFAAEATLLRVADLPLGVSLMVRARK